MPRDLDVAFVAVDEVQLAADLDRGHVFTDRLLNRRGRAGDAADRRGDDARRSSSGSCPASHVIPRPRLSQLTFAGEKKISRLPRRIGHRRLFGRGGLRDRRTDPAPARRRRRGARRALAAHPQRPGRTLSVRRRRLHRRDGRHRHGPQSRRRSRRLRLRPQVRRLQLPPPDSGGVGPDRRPRRAAHATARSARPAAARPSSEELVGALESHRSIRCGRCNGAIPPSISVRSRRCSRASTRVPAQTVCVRARLRTTHGA